MLMTLIGLSLQVEPFNCAQFQDHLRFINLTSEREVYACFCVYVHSLNHTYAHLRNDRMIKCRTVSM